MFLKSLVVATLCAVATNKPIELCEVPKEWGTHSYPLTDNCSTMDLKLHLNKFTIGGASHGAYMASNLFTMFNRNIDGANVNIGSGPCANAAIGEQDVGHIFTCTRSEQRYKTDGMQGKPVFMYAGVKDDIIPIPLSKQTADYFESQGANVKRLWIHDFGHMFPNNVQSNDFFNPVASCAPSHPFEATVAQCGYNMAYEVFSYLYGDLEAKDENYQESGKLYTVDQKSSMFPEGQLADQGYLYVPNSCLKEACGFHVEFHRANETLIFWNDTMIKRLGYMEWAATNNIIILFPQSDDAFWLHGWRSAFDQNVNNDQIRSIVQLVNDILDQDLFFDGVKAPQPSISGALSSVMNAISKKTSQLPFLNPFTTYNKEITQLIELSKKRQEQENKE